METLPFSNQKCSKITRTKKGVLLGYERFLTAFCKMSSGGGVLFWHLGENFEMFEMSLMQEIKNTGCLVAVIASVTSGIELKFRLMTPLKASAAVICSGRIKSRQVLEVSALAAFTHHSLHPKFPNCYIALILHAELQSISAAASQTKLYLQCELRIYFHSPRSLPFRLPFGQSGHE